MPVSRQAASLFAFISLLRTRASSGVSTHEDIFIFFVGGSVIKEVTHPLEKWHGRLAGLAKERKNTGGQEKEKALGIGEAWLNVCRNETYGQILLPWFLGS